MFRGAASFADPLDTASSLPFPPVRRSLPQWPSAARTPAETTWGRGMAEAAEGRIALTVGSAAMPPNPFAALASMVGQFFFR
jgi:hypothetical protein